MTPLIAALVLSGCGVLAVLLVLFNVKARLLVPSLLVLGIAALLTLTVGLEIEDADSALPPASPIVTSANDFEIEPASAPELFSQPTAFTFDDEGSLYVGTDSGITKARDLDGDGIFEDLQHFGYNGPFIFGLDFHEGSLYAAIDGSLIRFTDHDGDGFADEQTTLLDGLPRQHYGGHSNSGLIVAADGLIYMTVGGTSDHGPEPEPLGGTILTMGIEGGPATIYATGLRNPYDIAFCPDGRLYASDNGPDSIADDVAETAPDEVNLVLQGRDYGYPDYFGPQDPATGTESPVASLPERAGATGVVCHDGAGWPATYAGNVFVTLWGTFFAEVETGRRVMRVELSQADDGSVSGKTTEFAAGFGNPIDILQEPDGSMLVLDFGLGQIFRIRYTGD